MTKPVSSEPRGRNTRANLTGKAVNGLEKLVSRIELSVPDAADAEIQSALHFISKTIELFKTPEAELRRRKNVDGKRAWMAQQNQKETK